MSSADAPWLRRESLLAVPAAARGHWGFVKETDDGVGFEAVASERELAHRVETGPGIQFAWTPGDANLRTIYEVDAIAETVHAIGRRGALAALRRALPLAAAAVALIVLAVLLWPEQRREQFMGLLIVLIVVLPLWQRGVERAWDAWRSLRQQESDPDAWLAQQAHRLRFAVWAAPGSSKVAIGLVAAFVICYVVMVLRGPDAMIERFGLVKDRVRAGEWWRLVTCAFLHGGVVHLFFNSSVGLSLAKLCRALVDDVRIGIVFAAAAVAGSLASVLFTDKTSIGASGGILGWGGLLLGIALTHRALHGTGLVSSMLRWVMLLAVIGFAGASFIDNAAHAGGFLAGLGFGVVWGKRNERLPLGGSQWDTAES